VPVPEYDKETGKNRNRKRKNQKSRSRDSSIGRDLWNCVLCCGVCKTTRGAR